MKKLFDLDNPFFQYMIKLFQVGLLNLLWLLTSIPIITIGASTTAFYTVSLKLVRERSGYDMKSYFQAFAANFKKSTAAWLIAIPFLVIGFLDLNYFFALDTTQGYMLFGASVLILAIILMVFVCIFPVLAQFENNLRTALSVTFYIIGRHWYLILLTVILTGATIMELAYFFMFGPLLFFSTAVNTLLNAYIFKWIFNHYIEEEKVEE